MALVHFTSLLFPAEKIAVHFAKRNSSFYQSTITKFSKGKKPSFHRASHYLNYNWCPLGSLNAWPFSALDDSVSLLVVAFFQSFQQAFYPLTVPAENASSAPRSSAWVVLFLAVGRSSDPCNSPCIQFKRIIHYLRYWASKPCNYDERSTKKLAWLYGRQLHGKMNRWSGGSWIGWDKVLTPDGRRLQEPQRRRR